jgi:hypothetical protein
VGVREIGGFPPFCEVSDVKSGDQVSLCFDLVATQKDASSPGTINAIRRRPIMKGFFAIEQHDLQCRMCPLFVPLVSVRLD